MAYMARQWARRINARQKHEKIFKIFRRARFLMAGESPQFESAFGRHSLLLGRRCKTISEPAILYSGEMTATRSRLLPPASPPPRIFAEHSRRRTRRRQRAGSQLRREKQRRVPPDFSATTTPAQAGRARRSRCGGSAPIAPRDAEAAR